MKISSNHAQWILAASCLLLCARMGASQAVTLLDDARVSGEVIRLSDLLPPQSPHEMLEACRIIELGKSPQLGSARVLAQSQVVQYLAEVRAPWRFVIPGQIIVRRAGYPIRREATAAVISKFLLDRGRSARLPSAAWQWPGTMESLEKEPALEVTESHWDGQRHRRQLVLRCAKLSACNPFVVYVPEPNRPSDDSPLMGASRTTHLPRSGVAQESEAGPVLTRAGQRAIMLLEDGEVRISIQVICLQRGHLGQLIRVLDPTRRRVFRARVLASNLLRMPA